MVEEKMKNMKKREREMMGRTGVKNQGRAAVRNGRKEVKGLKRVGRGSGWWGRIRMRTRGLSDIVGKGGRVGRELFGECGLTGSKELPALNTLRYRLCREEEI